MIYLFILSILINIVLISYIAMVTTAQKVKETEFDESENFYN
jgi:hypothetical protein